MICFWDSGLGFLKAWDFATTIRIPGNVLNIMIPGLCFIFPESGSLWLRLKSVTWFPRLFMNQRLILTARGLGISFRHEAHVDKALGRERDVSKNLGGPPWGHVDVGRHRVRISWLQFNYSESQNFRDWEIWQMLQIFLKESCWERRLEEKEQFPKTWPITQLSILGIFFLGPNPFKISLGKTNSLEDEWDKRSLY